MKRKTPWILPIVLLVFLQQPVKAQTDTITYLDEIILAKSLIQKNAYGITSSNSIKQDKINAFGPLDAPLVLNQVPGVQVLSGALNTNRITIRGIGARTPYGTDKLRLYYNNIPITNGSGFSSIEAFDLANIGHVEVIKGPNGTSYGANLGGAIILNSNAPIVGRSEVVSSTVFGSYNLFKENLRLTHQTQKIHFNLSYNSIFTNGFRENNAFDRDGILLNLGVILSAKSKLAILLNHIDYTAQIPSSINKTDFDNNPKLAATNWNEAKGFEANKYTLAGLTYTYAFNDKLSNNTSIFYSYLDHFEPRPFNILDEFTNGFGLRSVFKGKLLNGNFTIGTELYKDEYFWETFENLYRENEGNGSIAGEKLNENKEFRTQFYLFGGYNHTISKKLTAQFGLSLNKTNYEFKDRFLSDGNTSATRDFDVILNPSLNLTYNLKNCILFTAINKGFSNPNLEETLTPDGIINPDIAQEKGWNFELGYNASFFKEKLQLKATTYFMKVKDLLVAERVGEDQYIGRNAGKTSHRGLELDASFNFKINPNWNISPYLNYSLNLHEFDEFIDDGINYAGNELTGVPKHVLNTGIAVHHKEVLSWFLNHNTVSNIPLNDANSIYSTAYSVFHTKIWYRPKITKAVQTQFQAGINNIFNTNYAQSILINAVGFGGSEPRYYYPGNGRNFYVGVQLKYFL